MKKLTPWYPGDVKPVRPGIYQRLLGSSAFYACFTSKGYWTLGHVSLPEAIYLATVCPSGFQNRPWRGLAEEPK